ncbi:uncharacterized protein LOC144031804 [Festucalex cinctus]
MIATTLLLILLQTKAAASNAVMVHQTPTSIIKRLGDNTEEIRCSHSIKDYNVILWYKQDRDGTMEYLGHLSATFSLLEEHLTGKVTLSGDASQYCDLNIANLILNDSAVYLCGASTVLQAGTRIVTKLATLAYLGLISQPNTCGSCLQRWRCEFSRLAKEQHPNVGTTLIGHVPDITHTEAATEDAVTVHQTPAFIIKRVGERTANELSCSHSITDYDVILWYKQGRGSTMEFLGYLNQKFPEPEDHLAGKINISGDGRQRSELAIANLSLNDTAVYFCAASTVLRIGPSAVKKQATLAYLDLISKSTPVATGSIVSQGQVTGIRFKQPGSKIVHAASRVDFQCSHDDGGQYVMLWYHQGKGRRPIQLVGFSHVGNEPEYQRHDPRVEISRVDTQRGSLSIHTVNASDTEPGHNPTPPVVTLLPPSPKECRNQKDKQNVKKTLVCAATGFFPDHVGISWQVDGQNVTTGVAKDANALPDGAFYKMTSRLRVAADLWFTPGRAFTCTVSFFDGKNTTLHSKTVYGIQGGKVTRVTYLRVAQSAKLSYAVLLVKSSVYASFVGFLLWKHQDWITKLNPS